MSFPYFNEHEYRAMYIDLVWSCSTCNDFILQGVLIKKNNNAITFERENGTPLTFENSNKMIIPKSYEFLYLLEAILNNRTDRLYMLKFHAKAVADSTLTCTNQDEAWKYKYLCLKYF